MPLGKIRQSFRNTIQNFWRRTLQIHDTAVNQRQYLAFGHLVRELYVSLFERASEAAHAVTILPDVFSFRFIQDVANVSACIAIRLDNGDEVLDQLLEEYVVFPERVVRVNQQCVASHRTWRSAAVVPRTGSPSLFQALSVYQPHGIFGDSRGSGGPAQFFRRVPHPRQS